MAGLGISAASIARTGNAMALSELNLKYLTPLRVTNAHIYICATSQVSKLKLRLKILKVQSSFYALHIFACSAVPSLSSG